MTAIRLTNNHDEQGKLVCENGTVAVIQLVSGINGNANLFTDEPMIEYGPAVTLPVEQIEVAHTDESGTYWLTVAEALASGLIED